MILGIISTNIIKGEPTIKATNPSTERYQQTSQWRMEVRKELVCQIFAGKPTKVHLIENHHSGMIEKCKAHNCGQD